LVSAHLRLEGAVDGPLGFDLLRAAPEAYGDTCEIGGTKSCGLRHLWSLDSDAEDIGLELHEQVIDDRAAVHAQRLQVDATVGFHGLEYIASLVAHGLQRGAGDVTAGRAASQADNSAASV